MRRVADWNIRLEDYFFKHVSTPFQWGKFDCVTFVTGAMKVVTGEEVTPKELSWSSYRGALRAMRQYSDGSLRGSVIKFASRFDPIPPHSIRSGDICLVRAAKDDEAVSIFSARGPMVATPDGVRPAKEGLISMAWRY